MRITLSLLVCGLVVGCDADSPLPLGHSRVTTDEIRAADVSVLFIGNSHTQFCQLPDTVCAMIRHRRPGWAVVYEVVGAAFLEDAAHNPVCRAEVDTRPWKHVVLQGQKVSTSGRFEYSRVEGIELAKAARDRGMAVHFYAEWGLRGMPGDGQRMEAVYQDLAKQSGAAIAPVGRAWDVALAADPDLPLYSADGNHQSEVGAFLTAAVLFHAVTGDDPLTLAEFDHPAADPATRRRLLATASQAVKHP